LSIKSSGLKRKRSQVSSEDEAVLPVKKTFVPKIIQSRADLALPEVGDFKYGDTASKVLGAKLTQNGIFVSVTWERRSDGVFPRPGLFLNTEVREKCPKLLVDFYESRINLK